MSEPVTLVIMAAGIGTRYGGGVKQLEKMGANGEIIMEYSIHDAIMAGFDRVVIILREEIAREFGETVGSRIEKACARRGIDLAYAIQRREDLPGGRVCPEGRTKPWGTGQAVLSCRHLISGPFVVINADDYYGRHCYENMIRFLHESGGKQEGGKRPLELCMAGFILSNTLSDHGAVTRGLCRVDGNGYLEDIRETRNIEKRMTPEGRVYAETDGEWLSPDREVSMNMWGLPVEFMDILETEFGKFLDAQEARGEEKKLTEEFLLPVLIGRLIIEQKVRVKVIRTDDRWFGVTYREDAELVRNALRKLIGQGVYSEDLYSDL